MGKGIVFSIAAAMLAAGVYGYSGQQARLATNERQAEHESRLLARNAALAGYSLAEQHLAEAFTSSSFSGEFGEAGYATTITVAGEEARIRSTGLYRDGSGEEIEVEVTGDFLREQAEIAEVVPPFMRYALASEGPLTLRGDILGEIYVQSGSNSPLNANMHTNGALTVQGNSVRVQGFGTYGTTAGFSSAVAAENSFVPNYNPSTSKAVSKTNPVSIPGYDAAEFIARRAPSMMTEGDLHLSGSHDLGGTRENPYVWHVTGNLSFSSTTSFSGYVLFLVDRNVQVYGNVSARASGYAGSDESSLGIYAGGSIEMGGSSTIWAQMYAAGDLVFLNGTPTVYGSLTTKGAAELRGTPNIYYRTASPALTYVWQNPRTAIRLIAYTEL